jgi:hypothetical protein
VVIEGVSEDCRVSVGIGVKSLSWGGGCECEGTLRRSGATELRSRTDVPVPRTGNPFGTATAHGSGAETRSDDLREQIRHRSGEGPIPSASHDVWSHRDEGIGRRLLARKNRNKKKDEPQTPEVPSSDDCPFVRDRTCARGPAVGRCRPGGLHNGGAMREDSAHCEIEVRCIKIAPYVKDCGCSCQVAQ